MSNDFDRDFTKLIKIMKGKESHIAIVESLLEEKKKLLKKYNSKVDTNVKIIGGEKAEEEEAKRLEKGETVEVELYTTMHLGSAHRIHDFICEYLGRSNQKNPGVEPGAAFAD